MGNKILIIDDDIKLQALLAKYLQEYGYDISSLYAAENVISEIYKLNPDILILDIVLPDGNGLELLKEIRKEVILPVIMLSAKGEDMDRIIGLELGADDYLSKPFNPRELLARIKAVLRRPAGQTGILKSNKKENTIHVGEISLNLSQQKVSKGKKDVELTVTEFQILKVMMSRPNIIFTRDELMTHARGDDYNVYDRTIDMHISRIRNKLKCITDSGSQIKSAWGRGYMFKDEQ